MNIKKLLAMILMVLMLVSTLASCNKDAENNEEKVLHLIYNAEYSSMLMENAGTTTDLGFCPPTCTEGLLSRDVYGNLVYGLADSYEQMKIKRSIHSISARDSTG